MNKPEYVKAIQKEALFYEFQGKCYLARVSIVVYVAGFSSAPIEAYQATFNTLEDGTIKLLDLTPSIESAGRDRNEIASDTEAAENLLKAHSYTMRLCRQINSGSVSKQSLTIDGWHVRSTRNL